MFCGFFKIQGGATVTLHPMCIEDSCAGDTQAEVLNFLHKLGLLRNALREFIVLIAERRAGVYRTWLNPPDHVFTASVAFSATPAVVMSETTYFEINDCTRKLRLFATQCPTRASYLSMLRRLDAELTKALHGARVVAQHMGIKVQ